MIDVYLTSIGIVAVAIGILGFIVFANNRKSITNQSFFLFCLMTIIWGVSNYFNNYPFGSPETILWILRIHISIAALHAFSFFNLAYTFPKDKMEFPKKYKLILIPLVILVALLNLSPLVFSGIAEISSTGEVSVAQPGPGILAFIALVVGLVGGGLFTLFKKTKRAQGIEKKQFRTVLIGTQLTFLLILIFNFVLPLGFQNVRYIPLGAIFILPFIISTAYSIIKYRFLHVKVIATQLVTFALWLILLVRLAAANTIQEKLLDGFIFATTVILGIFLIRSVLEEVKTREKMSQLALDLEITNQELKRLDEAKSDFISIASHQLRTPLSIIKGYMSMIREGTYGKVDSKLEDPIHKIYVSNERLINLVSDLLDLSRMERGKMQYEFQPVRLGDVAEGIVKDFEKVAKDKGLRFTWSRGKMNDLIKGDANKLRQIVLNLVDNAIKYTAKGSLHVEITSVPGGKIAFSVTDTGPGLTPEEAHALFQKFSRGQQESKSHTEGLGLGLYVAKLIAQAHGGELSVTSPGKGKGSTFSLILPLYNESAENFKKFAGEI